MTQESAKNLVLNTSGINKALLHRIGRDMALMFNRALMYEARHPYLLASMDAVLATIREPLKTMSPIVFILARQKLFIDDEPLDPRINVNRVVTYFERAKIESVSFYQGIGKTDLQRFIDIITARDTYPDAESIKTGMFNKGVQTIRVNHVYYTKMTEDEEIISRGFLDPASPQASETTHKTTKQMFFESAIESILREEFVQLLKLEDVMENPVQRTKELIASDLKRAEKGDGTHLEAGGLILQRLEAIDAEVDRTLDTDSQMDLRRTAAALCSMRKTLMNGIRAQNVRGVAYADENRIMDQATEIADKVVVRLIQKEYQAGAIGISRLSHILRRLIPEAGELKRMLPKIKTALLQAGMPMTDFRDLTEQLVSELQGEKLAEVIKANAERAGIDGEEVILAAQENPVRSSELIYLASEIRKAGGDEGELTRVLVEFVEKTASQMAEGAGAGDPDQGESHLRQVLGALKVNLVGQLGSEGVQDDAIGRLEDKLNQRIDGVLLDLKKGWIRSQPARVAATSIRQASLLETIAKSVTMNPDFGELLEIVRAKVEGGEIDENDFEQIYGEIARQEQLKKAKREKKTQSAGVLGSDTLMTFIDKEIAVAKRYGTPLSAVGLSLVKANMQTQNADIGRADVFDAFLTALAAIFRTSDVVGDMGKNQYVAVLPMTSLEEANLALRRTMKILYLKPLEVKGVPFDIKVAGVVADMPPEDIPNAAAWLDRILIQLREMVLRIRNLHVL